MTEAPEKERIDIEKFLPWGSPIRVHTKNGPRILSKATPSEKFWQAWRSDKEELRKAGISCGKDPKTNKWEVYWWRQLPPDELAKLRQNVEQSQQVAADVKLTVPDGLDYRPYQKAAILYAREKEGVLFGDEMGLGKTMEAIGVINDHPEFSKVLVICPAAVKLNWERELRKWLVREFDIAVAHGSTWPVMADVVVINWDILGRHIDVISSGNWDAVIADEIHYVRNMKTKRWKALKSSTGKIRMGLTGTPIMNKLMDVFPILHWLQPDQFRSRFGFQHKFSDDFGNSTKEQRKKLQLRLRESCMIRRLKAEVLSELPAKQRQVIELDPPDEVLRLEKSAASEKDEETLAELQAALELAKTSDDQREYLDALAQLKAGYKVAFENTARVRHETAKAKCTFTLAHIKTCLETVNKIVVWFHHRDCGERLHSELRGSSVMIYGGMTSEQRDDRIQRFINDPECKVFLGSIRATGTGIDGLQKVCSWEIFHELDWVPMVMCQAEDRLHRIGQDGHVMVQVMAFAETIDCQIAHACVEKQNLADQCLDDERDKLLTEPVLPVKQKTRLSVTKKELEVADVSPDAALAIHECLQILASSCDGATSQDQMGFNKFDAALGRKLACLASLTDAQAILGKKIIRKYRRQLPDTLRGQALQ